MQVIVLFDKNTRFSDRWSILNASWPILLLLLLEYEIVSVLVARPWTEPKINTMIIS